MLTVFISQQIKGKKHKVQGSTYPTARRSGASKTVRRASRFGQIFLLNHIWSGIEKSKFWKSGKWIFWETASPEGICHKRVSEWLSLAAFLGTVDIGVHIIHTSRVIIAYTLESQKRSSSFQYKDCLSRYWGCHYKDKAFVKKIVDKIN